MKCPSCDASPIQPLMEAFNAGVPMGRKWKCVAFVCNRCRAVIGTQVDPVALKTDIINGVVAALRKP